MSKTNYDVAHEFFYSGFDYYNHHSGKSVWYEGKNFNSYSTTIARVAETNRGDMVTLVSIYNMSKTTAKHIRLVISASPYAVLYVPTRWGVKLPKDDKQALEMIAGWFENDLMRASASRLTIKKNRDEFLELLSCAEKFNTNFHRVRGLSKYRKLRDMLVNDLDKIREKQRIADHKERAKCEKIFKKTLKGLDLLTATAWDIHMLSVPVAVKTKLFKHQDSLFKEKAADEIAKFETMSYKELSAVITNNPYARREKCDILHRKLVENAEARFKEVAGYSLEALKEYLKTIGDNFVLQRKVQDKIASLENEAFMSKIGDSLEKNGVSATLSNVYSSGNKREFELLTRSLVKYDIELAYCFLDGDDIRTTKGIRFPIDSAKLHLRMWKHGKIRHGMQIGMYTVLYVTNEFVKVGCHKIPTQNLNELCKILDVQ